MGSGEKILTDRFLPNTLISNKCLKKVPNNNQGVTFPSPTNQLLFQFGCVQEINQGYVTTKRPQTHISIAVRGFNVKLPFDLGIELRFCLGFALGKHPLQVPLCISLWAHRPSSALLNHACTVANCIKCGNQSKASPFQIFLWQFLPLV